MKRSQFVRMLVVIALLAVTPALLFGQAVNFATIHGRVADKSDAAVPGAQVKATQVATGLVRNTTTSNEGNFTIPNLPVGEYKVEVSAKGFKDYVQTGITLTVGSSAAVNAALEVGAVNETVEVHADAAMVETHENSITTLIDNNRIMEMPLNGRSTSDLILISGAATNIAPASQDLTSSKNYASGSGGMSGTSMTMSIAGSQSNSNNYLLDGADNTDSFSNVNAPFPFPDAIQEFSVQSSGLNARYGKQAGAVVNVVTKSGTNKFHGDAFEFIRNPIINAHHTFWTPSQGADPTIKRNQFGGTFGGPIKKDKILFFMGYQGTRERSGTIASTTIPTQAMLNGDWSACSGTYNSAYFTGNQIDPAKYNKQALELVKYLPTDKTTSGCGSITYGYGTPRNEDMGVAKVDFNLSSQHSLYTRYFVSDFRSPVEWTPENILSQSNPSQFARSQNVVIGDTYTLSSGWVNSARVAFRRMAINRGPSNQMPNFSDLGVNVATPIPNGMVLSVSGAFSVGGGSSMPGYFINNNYQFADDVDIIKGKHQISFGASMQRMQLNYLSTFQSNGQYTFGGKYSSSNNLADFLLGLPSTFLQGNPEAENWRMTYMGFYVHDNYKIKPNLTLNAGVRWEPFFPSIDAFSRGSHFDYQNFLKGVSSSVYPYSNTPTGSIPSPAGLLYCGDKAVPCAFANAKWGQFSPRAGLIWDPRGKGKETIRAGYGLYYDSPELYYFDRYADNSPFGSGISITPTATGGFTNPYDGQTGIPAFPTPFPTADNAFFPTFGVYINNEYDINPMYVQNWNLSVEKQFGANWSASATYLGSKTTHIWAAYEANPALYVNVGANSLGCTPGAPSAKNTNCRRALYVANPDQGKYFSNMTSLWDGANSEYNAMLLSAKHRFANNFTVLANYTWSHCISDQDFAGELTNSRPTLYPSSITAPNYAALKNDRGDCAFDVRQSVNTSVVVTSPKHTGTLGMFLNDWQLAPLMQYRTGQAFTVTTGADTALTGSTTSYKDRPNQIGDPNSGTCTRSGVTYPVGSLNCYFNTSAFATPTAADIVAPYGPFGNLGRNTLRGPGAFMFNTSLSRSFKLTESKQLNFRFEVFNLFNHPVLSNPTSSMSSGDYGKIKTTINSVDPRTFQAAVKYTF